MFVRLVDLGGVSRTLPARYSIGLSMEDADEPYALTVAMLAVDTMQGKDQGLSCRIGKQTLDDLIAALTAARDEMEGSP